MSKQKMQTGINNKNTEKSSKIREKKNCNSTHLQFMTSTNTLMEKNNLSIDRD